MPQLHRWADKAGFAGSLLSAAACVNCYPALASLGALLGLGALSSYEGLFVRILLPGFAGLALLAHALAWWRHRQWPRAALGMLGPLLVLGSVVVMRITGHRTGWLMYPGLALMLISSLLDLLTPAPAACHPSRPSP